MRVSNKPILLIEDDVVDVMTVRRALKELQVPNTVTHVEHGEAALAYLADAASERPCLILLDLNMPVMNGIEFLRAIKQDTALRSIPVVMLTTSEEPKDRTRSFDLGVAGYMAKPVDYRKFVEMMRSIDLYWSASEMP